MYSFAHQYLRGLIHPLSKSSPTTIMSMIQLQLLEATVIIKEHYEREIPCVLRFLAYAFAFLIIPVLDRYLDHFLSDKYILILEPASTFVPALGS